MSHVLVLFFINTLLVGAVNTFGYQFLPSDPSSILATTLFTFQDFSCDNEYMRMQCPEGTTINIQWAQYGRLLPSTQMCPDLRIIKDPQFRENTSCLITTSLEVVLKDCQNVQRCKLLVSSQTFGRQNDQCPDTTKYLEVAYQCRPQEFRTRVACEGEELELNCQQKHKLAVYSAAFGRSQNHDSDNQCPNSNSYDAECLARCGLQKMIERCHGRRQCSVPATEQVFGNTCRSGTSKYLRVVYACVPKRVLRELSESEFSSFCGDDEPNDDWADSWQKLTQQDPWSYKTGAPGLVPTPSTVRGGSSTSPSISPSVSLEPEVSPVKDDDLGFVSDFLITWQHIKDNRERFILYLVVSLLVGVILVLLLVIFNLKCRPRHSQPTRRGKLDISTPTPATSRPTEASVWESGLSPSEPDAPTSLPPPHALHRNPEEGRLLSPADRDMATGPTHDPQAPPVVFAAGGVVRGPEGYRTMPRDPPAGYNHYSTTPRTFASPTNGATPYHSHTLGPGQTNANGYTNDFRTSPKRSNSLLQYDSTGSMFDNYYQ